MPPLRLPICRSSLRLPARSLALACGLAGAGIAAAGDFSIGLGAGVDRGKVECLSSYPCDRSSSHWKLSAGYRIVDAVELQALYFDAGKFKGADTTPLGTEFGGSFKVSGLGLSAGFRWQLAPGWSLAARAGAASVRTRFSYAPPFDGSKGKTTLQPLAGIGIGYDLTPALRVGLDYDLTRFKAHEARGSLQMLGLAMQYSF